LVKIWSALEPKRKISQGNIARVLKADSAYISNIENGKKTPTCATIQNLADELLKWAKKLKFHGITADYSSPNGS
jgi:transcriptional regulator with XRE-family HTH domain